MTDYIYRAKVVFFIAYALVSSLVSSTDELLNTFAPLLRRRSTVKRGFRRKSSRDICGENYINVDRFFLVAMPILFLIFNLVYWLYFGGHLLLADSTPREKY